MLIAFEGIDGSGKGTQARMLIERLANSKIPAVSFTFPTYNANPFAEAVGRYLNGDFGLLDAVAPEFAAVLFAGDRFTARKSIAEHLHAGAVVVCDRYIASNLAHQGAKLPGPRRPEFFRWLLSIEYGVYEMPRPDLTIYLDMPVAVATRLVALKGKRTYTDLKADIHEQDAPYLEECRSAYQAAFAEDNSNRVAVISCCIQNHELRTSEQVSDEIWELVTRHEVVAGRGSSAR